MHETSSMINLSSLTYIYNYSAFVFSRRNFGRYILYSNLFIYVVYVATLNTYMTLVPAMATSVVDNDRHCPVVLTEDEALNETIVEQRKQV